MAENLVGNKNRVTGSCPHHPAYLGSGKVLAQHSCDKKGTAYCGALSDSHLSWIKRPPMPPGPELRYLYEHHTAKSTFQSCKVMGTLPIAWARSQPQIQPLGVKCISAKVSLVEHQ